MALVSPTQAPARWFHRRLDGYARTPLADLDDLAAKVGVGRIWCKVEDERFGLPSFKILGASWAAYRALQVRLGFDDHWSTLEALRGRTAESGIRLVAATEGNHGRAVARAAAWFGVDARIYVPLTASPRTVGAITAEGAEVIRVDGTYDHAVDEVIRHSASKDLVIADIARTPTDETARRVIEGYATISDEVCEELAEIGEATPDVAVAQVGVGSFAASLVRGPFERVFAVEAAGHACVAASLAAGTLVSTPTAPVTEMFGLNCSSPSAVAWEVLASGLAGAIEVGDDSALEAAHLLEAAGVATTRTGACGFAGLIEGVRSGWIDPHASVLIVVTEGVHA